MRSHGPQVVRVTRSHKFYRALCQPHALTLDFDWFIRFSVSFVIGYFDYFGFGLTTLIIENRSEFECSQRANNTQLTWVKTW